MEYKEYKRTNSSIPDNNVREFQSMLNIARERAKVIVAEDKRTYGIMLTQPYYFEEVHHRNYVPSGWCILCPVDGLFGPQTERAVKAFQRFVFLEENGIMGPYTLSHLKKICSLPFPTRRMLQQAGHITQDGLDIDGLIISPAFQYQNETLTTSLLGAFMENVVDSPQFRQLVENGLHDQKLFRDFARRLSDKVQASAVRQDSRVQEQRKTIIKTVKDKNNYPKGTKDYRRLSKIQKIEHNKLKRLIKKVCDSNRMKPGDMARNVSRGVSSAGNAVGRVARWWGVAKASFILIVHLLKYDGTDTWEKRFVSLFYDILDQVMLAVITSVTTAIALAGIALAAGTTIGGLPVLVVIIVSLIVALVINLIYEYFRGNEESAKPVTLSVYDNLDTWINSLYLR